MTNSPRLLMAAFLACAAFGCEPADPHAGHDHGAEADTAHADEEHAQPETDDGHDHEAGAEEPPAHDEHEDAGVIHADAATLAEFGVRFAPAVPGEIARTVALTGEVTLSPDGVAHVTARVGGVITEAMRTVGDRVEPGEVLATVESPELAEAKAAYLQRVGEAQLAATDLARAEVVHANTQKLLSLIRTALAVEQLRAGLQDLDIGARRSELITSYAAYRAAEAAYHREKSLRAQDVSSEADYIEAESAFKTAWVTFQATQDDLVFRNQRELDAARGAAIGANVALAAAERTLHAFGLDEAAVDRVENESDMELARHTVVAPLGGIITQRHAVRGERIEAGDEIFVVADLSTVWIEFSVYPKDLGAVKPGAAARIAWDHGPAEAVGTIDYISPLLDPHTRTAMARIILPNPDGAWRPGTFVQGHVDVDAAPADIVVPGEALQQLDGRPVVFVQTPDGVEPREVEVGRRGDSTVEIVKGLAPGDLVAISGLVALKAELDKAALEHAGHAH
ncbi:MAG: efflux RND transporter periplasmic adaptor subunit [Phycisphaerales bacterium JB039]